MLDAKTKAYIRGLVFPFQFKSDLSANAVVNAAIDLIKQDHEYTEGYVAAIRSALESDDPLSDIVEEPPSGAAIRSFLAAVYARLEKS